MADCFIVGILYWLELNDSLVTKHVGDTTQIHRVKQKTRSMQFFVNNSATAKSFIDEYKTHTSVECQLLQVHVFRQ